MYIPIETTGECKYPQGLPKVTRFDLLQQRSYSAASRRMSLKKCNKGVVVVICRSGDRRLTAWKHGLMSAERPQMLSEQRSVKLKTRIAIFDAKYANVVNTDISFCISTQAVVALWSTLRMLTFILCVYFFVLIRSISPFSSHQNPVFVYILQCLSGYPSVHFSTYPVYLLTVPVVNCYYENWHSLVERVKNFMGRTPSPTLTWTNCPF